MMKYFRPWLTIFSVTFLLILQLSPAHADSTFTFQIVGRGAPTSQTGPFPTGLFKMTLETTASVVGAMVSSPGGTCTIPASGDCHYTTSSGDRVSVLQDTGNPNNAIIKYYPLSLLAPPSPSYNYCTPSGPQASGAPLEIRNDDLHGSYHQRVSQKHIHAGYQFWGANV